jgi:optic atrophy 3 protein
LGNKYHVFETKLNKELLQLENSDFFVKPLTQIEAVEKGIEFYYELLFYSIIIGLPLYELYRGSKEAEEKSIK